MNWRGRACGRSCRNGARTAASLSLTNRGAAALGLEEGRGYSLDAGGTRELAEILERLAAVLQV